MTAENSNEPANNGQASLQAREIRRLERTLKVRSGDLDFMQQLDGQAIADLRSEMRSALASRHHAFKQSLLYARDHLPFFSRRRVKKQFSEPKT